MIIRFSRLRWRKSVWAEKSNHVFHHLLSCVGQLYILNRNKTWISFCECPQNILWKLWFFCFFFIFKFTSKGSFVWAKNSLFLMIFFAVCRVIMYFEGSKKRISLCGCCQIRVSLFWTKILDFLGIFFDRFWGLRCKEVT